MFQFRFHVLVQFLCIVNAFAGDRALILSGGGDPKNAAQRYEEISKKAYDVFTKGKKIPTQVIAKDGSWGFAKPSDNFPATNKEEVKKIIAANLRALGPGDVLDLFVNDHGTKMGNDKNKTLKNTGIVLYSPIPGKREVLSHQELADLIQENKPAGAYVKMIGIHCYAGGLNEIASKVDGVCGSTSTGDETVTLSSKINKHGEGFFNKLMSSYTDKQKSDNLVNLHAAGVENDVLNNARNQLSSQAYLESLMPSFDGANYSINQLEIDIESMLTYADRESSGTLGKLNAELKARQFLCSEQLIFGKQPGLKNLATVEEEIRNKFSPEAIFVNTTSMYLEKQQKPLKEFLKKIWPEFKKEYAVFEDSKKKLKTEFENKQNLILPPSSVESGKLRDEYKNQLRKMYTTFRKKFTSAEGNLYEIMSVVRQTEIVRRALKSPGLTLKEKEKLASIYRCESSKF